jgi:hypothetical protein
MDPGFSPGKREQKLQFFISISILAQPLALYTRVTASKERSGPKPDSPVPAENAGENAAIAVFGARVVSGK